MKKVVVAAATVCLLIPLTAAALHADDLGERYDADQDGVISRSEVVTAISDYFAGEITRRDVIEILTLYFSGESVEVSGPTPPSDPADLIEVEPEVWDCYLDRAATEPSDFVFGCGGWGPEEIVHKWDNDNPVVVWATGADFYLELLEKAMAELSPILGLDFRLTDQKDDANLLACVGVANRARTIRCGQGLEVDCEPDPLTST